MKQISSSTVVQVVAAGISLSPLTATHGVGQNYSFSNLPTCWSRLKITWGDGTTAYYSSATPYHNYAGAGSKSLNVYVYNASGVQIGSKSAIVTVN